MRRTGRADRPHACRRRDGPILEVSGLSKTFGGLQALQGVGFSVRRGAILGIIGPNGAGKTTLFNLLNGFVRPDRGRVVFQGVDLIGLKPNRICRLGIGRTFQVVRAFARMSVLQNVAVGALVATRSDDEALQTGSRRARPRGSARSRRRGRCGPHQPASCG